MEQFVQCNKCDDESARSCRVKSLRSLQVVTKTAGKERIKTCFFNNYKKNNLKKINKKGFVTTRETLSQIMFTTYLPVS